MNKYHLGCCAVVLIVLLRIGIGWHFLYEGVHKFDPAAGFTSEGFLGIAKGPAADIYYWMLPDLDGIQRVAIADIKDENGKDCKTFTVYEDAWKEYFEKYLTIYSPIVPREADAKAIVNMSGIEFAAKIKEKLPSDIAKDLGGAYTTPLIAWAERYLPSADAKGIVDLDAAQLVAWVRQSQQSVVEANGDAPEKIEESATRLVAIANAAAARFAAWANVPSVHSLSDIVALTAVQRADWAKQNLPTAVAEDVIKMDAAQLAAWTKENLPLKDVSKRDDAAELVKVITLVRAKAIFNQYLGSLREGAADVEQDIEAFLKSRERFLETKKNVRNGASFEQERRWNFMLFYRAQAAGWTRMLETMGNGLQSDLGRLVDSELAGQKGEISTAPERALIPPNNYNISISVPQIKLSIPPKNPYVKGVDVSVQTRMQAMDAAVMFGLFAIGLCMVLGFCARLACLGGAAFLVNVILTTFPVPGFYPEIPSMVGNFMGVSKDVVELLAILFLVTVPSGRWGGLDYFLWHYGGKQIVGLFSSDEDAIA